MRTLFSSSCLLRLLNTQNATKHLKKFSFFCCFTYEHENNLIIFFSRSLVRSLHSAQFVRTMISIQTKHFTCNHTTNANNITCRMKCKMHLTSSGTFFSTLSSRYWLLRNGICLLGCRLLSYAHQRLSQSFSVAQTNQQKVTRLIETYLLCTRRDTHFQTEIKIII